MIDWSLTAKILVVLLNLLVCDLARKWYIAVQHNLSFKFGFSSSEVSTETGNFAAIVSLANTSGSLFGQYILCPLADKVGVLRVMCLSSVISGLFFAIMGLVDNLYYFLLISFFTNFF